MKEKRSYQFIEAVVPYIILALAWNALGVQITNISI